MKALIPKTPATFQKFELTLTCKDGNKRIHFLDVVTMETGSNFYLEDFYGWPVPSSNPEWSEAKKIFENNLTN